MTQVGDFKVVVLWDSKNCRLTKYGINEMIGNITTSLQQIDRMYTVLNNFHKSQHNRLQW